MKIIKRPKFKPITCSRCGGIYECTKRDMRKIIRCDEWWNSPALRCPFCGYANDLEPVRESENSDTGNSTKEYVQRWIHEHFFKNQ